LKALDLAKDKDREKLLKAFGARDTVSSGELKEAVRIISDIGIEQDVRNLAKKYMLDALASIETYHDSYAKRALQFSADFVVGRSL
jgi:geranylgeranyl pyrophosphate synthase